jgi:hypothetical protein
MHDCEAKVLLTASGVMRGNKKIDLKAIADSGLEMCEKQGELATHQLAPQAAVSIRAKDLWQPASDSSKKQGDLSKQQLARQAAVSIRLGVRGYGSQHQAAGRGRVSTLHSTCTSSSSCTAGIGPAGQHEATRHIHQARVNTQCCSESLRR